MAVVEVEIERSGHYMRVDGSRRQRMCIFLFFIFCFLVFLFIIGFFLVSVGAAGET